MQADDSQFFFSPNFAFGSNSVFTDIHTEGTGIVPPPISGYFLLLQGDPMILLDSTNFDLL